MTIKPTRHRNQIEINVRLSRDKHSVNMLMTNDFLLYKKLWCVFPQGMIYSSLVREKQNIRLGHNLGIKSTKLMYKSTKKY